MKRRVILVLLVLAAIAGLLWKWQCARVETTENGLTLYGNVDIRRVQLSFPMQGRLAEVRFEEGDRLKKGEIVAKLVRTTFDEDLARAQAERDQAAAELTRLKNGTRPQEIAQARALVDERKAALKSVEVEFNRRAALVEIGAVTGQSYDDIAARRDQAQAQLQAAEAALSLAVEGPRQEDIAVAQARLAAAEAAVARAQTRVGDTELKAPNAGILMTRVEEPGAVVGAGQAVAVLSLTNPVWVRTYVAEPDLGRVWPGMKAEIVTDSRPDQPYHGQVGFISPEAEFTPKAVQTPQLRTDLVFRVRIIADNPDEGLRQGMPVTVHLDTSQMRFQEGPNTPAEVPPQGQASGGRRDG